MPAMRRRTKGLPQTSKATVGSGPARNACVEELAQAWDRTVFKTDGNAAQQAEAKLFWNPGRRLTTRSKPRFIGQTCIKNHNRLKRMSIHKLFLDLFF